MKQLLFIFLCIPVRLLISTLPLNLSVDYLRLLGVISLIPAVGFFYYYSKDDVNNFGQDVWWQAIRPVHGALWLLAGILALFDKPELSSGFFTIDVIVGILALYSRNLGYFPG